jgi:hypothetical protein
MTKLDETFRVQIGQGLSGLLWIYIEVKVSLLDSRREQASKGQEE